VLTSDLESMLFIAFMQYVFFVFCATILGNVETYSFSDLEKTLEVRKFWVKCRSGRRAKALRRTMISHMEDQAPLYLWKTICEFQDLYNHFIKISSSGHPIHDRVVAEANLQDLVEEIYKLYLADNALLKVVLEDDIRYQIHRYVDKKTRGEDLEQELPLMLIGMAELELSVSKLLSDKSPEFWEGYEEESRAILGFNDGLEMATMSKNSDIPIRSPLLTPMRIVQD